MTWDIQNFLEHLSGSNDVETNDNLVSCLFGKHQYETSVFHSSSLPFPTSTLLLDYPGSMVTVWQLIGSCRELSIK